MITIIARKHLRYDAQGNDIARVYIPVRERKCGSQTTASSTDGSCD